MIIWAGEGLLYIGGRYVYEPGYKVRQLPMNKFIGLQLPRGAALGLVDDSPSLVGACLSRIKRFAILRAPSKSLFKE